MEKMVILNWKVVNVRGNILDILTKKVDGVAVNYSIKFTPNHNHSWKDLGLEEVR